VYTGGFQDKVTESSDFPTTVTFGASDAENYFTIFDYGLF